VTFTTVEGEELPFDFGDSFTVQIPEDIISGRQGPFQPGQRRYGLYIVFFAVCAGQLDLDVDVDPEAAGSTGTSSSATARFTRSRT
jgi:hypothetical protein